MAAMAGATMSCSLSCSVACRIFDAVLRKSFVTQWGGKGVFVSILPIALLRIRMCNIMSLDSCLKRNYSDLKRSIVKIWRTKLDNLNLSQSVGLNSRQLAGFQNSFCRTFGLNN